MKKYSMQQIKDSLPVHKRKDDSLVAIYLSRPLSFPLTYVFVNYGISAWGVSVFSLIVAAMGSCFLWSNSSYIRWVGCGLLFLWSVLDCVDGNIARVTGTSSPFGSFMDAESGYVISALIYLSFGMAAFHTGNIIKIAPELFILFGALASIFDILARLVHQRYMVSKLEAFGKEEKNKSQYTSKLMRIRKKVSAEFGIAGFVLAAAFLGELFKLYDLFTIIYVFYCFFSMSVTIVIYSLRAKIK